MLRELVLAIGSSVCTLAAKYRWSASSSGVPPWRRHLLPLQPLLRSPRYKWLTSATTSGPVAAFLLLLLL